MQANTQEEALLLERETMLAKIEELEQENAELKFNVADWAQRYYAVADEICATSESTADLCRQAGQTREERNRLREENAKLKAERDRYRDIAERLVAHGEAFRLADAAEWGQAKIDLLEITSRFKAK